MNRSLLSDLPTNATVQSLLPAVGESPIYTAGFIYGPSCTIHYASYAAGCLIRKL